MSHVDAPSVTSGKSVLLPDSLYLHSLHSVPQLTKGEHEKPTQHPLQPKIC